MRKSLLDKYIVYRNHVRQFDDFCSHIDKLDLVILFLSIRQSALL